MMTDRAVIELDHVFICIDSADRGVEILNTLGLKETMTREHPGQGTANHLYAFNNAVLELLYVADKQDLQSELTSPTKLYERFYDDSGAASPFGICLRPAAKTKVELPFNHWAYRPSYLPDHLAIEVADSDVSEPMWFYLSFAGRPDEKGNSGEDKQPFLEITSIKLTLTSTQPLSDAAMAINQLETINLQQGSEHLLELEFDGGVSNQLYDCRPTLPLVVRY